MTIESDAAYSLQRSNRQRAELRTHDVHPLRFLEPKATTNTGRKIYLASSWRNDRQPEVLDRLRTAGFDVYDFRNPHPGDTGFAWSEIDPLWELWGPRKFLAALDTPIARRGYGNDWEAMEWADTGVLLLPSGRSAHLEAGYFAGTPGKSLHILLQGQNEPELMYKMANSISLDVDELIWNLQRRSPQ